MNACGHFRTGILNAPLTGRVVAELAAGKAASFPIEPFPFSRFSGSESSPAAPQEDHLSEAMRLVPSMKCEGCEATIRRMLQGVPSVRGVRIQVADDALFVRYERSPSALAPKARWPRRGVR